MAQIVFADKTGRYDGRDLEKRPLGGTESSVIQCARELAKRGHAVTVYSNCEQAIEDHGVSWRPLNGTLPQECDLYVACHQLELLGLVKAPRRRVLWVLWPVSQLRHYKKIWRMWFYRPVPVLMSLYQAKTYSSFLPHRNPHIVLPLGLPKDIRDYVELPEVPQRRAIFASNPQRNLRHLVEIWVERILPHVPDAVLDVYGINGLKSGENAWDHWEGSLLPSGVSEAAKKSVRVHAPQSRQELIKSMRESKVLLYLGHKSEAFCLSVAEAQALGVPAVVSDLNVLPERVIDGLTGFVRKNDEEFAQAAIALLKDDQLWRSQHKAAIQYQQGISWSEYAGRFESALLADTQSIYRSVMALPPG